MEQIRKFLRDKGFALALLACLVAEAAEVAEATAALAVADKGALQYDWHEWYKRINNQSGATTTNKVQ